MYTQLVRVWKEAIVAYLKSVSEHLVEETEENHTKLDQGSWFRGQDLKQGSPEYKVGVLDPTQSGVSHLNPIYIVTTNFSTFH
jgi:hypothetical protein